MKQFLFIVCFLFVGTAPLFADSSKWRKSFSASEQEQIGALLDDARAAGLKTQMLENKIHEGVAKNKSADVIIRALSVRMANMKRAAEVANDNASFNKHLFVIESQTPENPLPGKGIAKKGGESQSQASAHKGHRNKFKKDSHPDKGLKGLERKENKLAIQAKKKALMLEKKQERQEERLKKKQQKIEHVADKKAQLFEQKLDKKIERQQRKLEKKNR
ncbi:MAG: hypothetical protein HQK83_19490 [Fibrobacteria bacterium]|nr:hypothetical protein [Fibrobacteria bacterium]